MADTLDLDDDLTGQVRAAMSEPVSSPDNAIRKLNVTSILTLHRIRRMERIALWLAATVIAGSLSVIVSVIGSAIWASYTTGARMERFQVLVERVENLEHRMNEGFR